MKYIFLTFLLLPLSIQAEEWHSGTKQVQLVELYTSEGCSSCPPADHWLSRFKDDPKLFEDIIPIAFHVDYWDYIGWKDPFASPEHTQRQRDYAKAGHISQVYTPGFVVNNKEWHSWFRGNRVLPESTNISGELDVVLLEDGNILNVNYSADGDAVLNVAYLGMGLKSDISAGENRNKLLEHDFVALNYFTLTGNKKWTTTLPEIPQLGQERTALAVWVSDKNSKEILQATGGYLN